jgi:hypothetical protein
VCQLRPFVFEPPEALVSAVLGKSEDIWGNLRADEGAKRKDEVSFRQLYVQLEVFRID